MIESDDIDSVLLASERFRASVENLVVEAIDIKIGITTSVGIGRMTRWRQPRQCFTTS